MDRRRRFGAPILPLSLPFAIVALALGLSFGAAVAQFDGAPDAPEPFQSHAEFSSWDVQIHSRDQASWGDQKLSPMKADHGADCSAPPDTHETHSYSGAVFVCKDHLMTAISETGYGLVVLTPNQLADFSRGPATLRFDMSTFRSSDRDWVDFWLTPWEDNLTLPFDTGVVDLQGPPKNAVQIKMNQFKGKTDFTAAVIRDSKLTELPRAYKFMQNSFVPDKARRDQFELQISRTHIKFWMPAYNLVWVDKDIEPLPFSQAVFQLAHHSYNPGKGECIDNCPGKASGDTWHWDNVSVEPSSPFIVMHGSPRALVSGKSGDGGSVDFGAPAPANAYLRFSALADVNVSFDDGATYEQVQPQKSMQAMTASYFMPVPEGTRKVRLKFGPSVANWYKGPFTASDFAIWARTTGAPDPSAVKRPVKPPDTGSGGLRSPFADLSSLNDVLRRSLGWAKFVCIMPTS